MNDARPLAQNDGPLRPPRDCFAPYGLGQYLILNVGEMLLDFAASVHDLDSVGEMRPGLHAYSVL